MGVLGQYGPNALGYWGSILASAAKGLATQDVWNAIRAEQARIGPGAPRPSGADVSVLRGYANRLLNAQNALASASPSDTITADMMGVGPYSQQTLQGITTTPTYQVAFQNQVQLPDGTVTEVWQTAVFSSGNWPGTVGDLQASLESSASELAAQGSESSSTTPRGVSLGVLQTRIVQI